MHALDRRALAAHFAQFAPAASTSETAGSCCSNEPNQRLRAVELAGTLSRIGLYEYVCGTFSELVEGLANTTRWANCLRPSSELGRVGHLAGRAAGDVRLGAGRHAAPPHGHLGGAHPAAPALAGRGRGDGCSCMQPRSGVPRGCGGFPAATSSKKRHRSRKGDRLRRKKR
eukprot:scaffold9106_cov118-Isochrysis_galbana.AAC.6